MEQHHDEKKAALAKRISKFGLAALWLTGTAAVLELAMLVRNTVVNVRWMSAQPTAEPTDILEYLITVSNYGFWTETVPCALLLIALLVILVILYRRIRRDGTPFRFGNVRLLRIGAVLMGLRVLIPPVEKTVMDFLNYGYSSLTLGNMRTLLFRNTGGIWLFTALLLCSEVMYYGAVLQKQSDETL